MSDPAPLLECHRCGAGFDVAGLKPDARFRCEACGAWLRVPRPKRRAPWIAVACAASAIAGAAIVYLLASTGGAPPPAPTPASTPAPAPAPETARPAAAPAATAPDRPAEAPAQPEADPLALEFEALRERTRSGRIPDLLAFARFCRRNERYAAEAERAFRAVLVLDPEHEAALDALGLACLEGLVVPRDWYDALMKSPWYRNAVALLDREVTSKQRLRDVGLSYAYAPPFVLVCERLDDEGGDRQVRRKAAAILQGLGPAFNELIGKDLGLDAANLTEVVPVFWFRSRRAEQAYEESCEPELLETGMSRVERNPYWCVCGESDITRLTRSALVVDAAQSLAEAATARKPFLPDWVIDGLADMLGRIHCAADSAAGFEVRYDVADGSGLQSLARSQERPTIAAVLERTAAAQKIVQQLLEEMKKRGMDPDDVTIDVSRFTGLIDPDAAWGLTAFLLKSDPARRERFLDFLKRMRDGQTEADAFHAAFKDTEDKADLEAFDRAWVEWLKSESART